MHLLCFSSFPCSSVANASSLLRISPRIFTAKTLRPLRSSRQVMISYLPLRSSRLRGENAFILLFSILIPCNSVFVRGKCFSLLASSPRIFTAKTLRSRKVMISCFPLRSLRLSGEMFLFFFPVYIRGKCFFFADRRSRWF